MSKKYLVLFAWILSCAGMQFANGQETVYLEGIVLNDSINRSQLNIVNESTNLGTTTTNDGRFIIPVRLGDLVTVSAVQYEPKQFVVNETMYRRKKITLYLIPKIEELDEVNVSNIDLSGDIQRDTKNTPIASVLTAGSLGLPENTAPKRTVEERRYYTAVTSGSGIPLDGLINAITGRLKMLKKHIEVSRFEQKVQQVRDTFSDEAYMKDLNIPEQRIEDFVYYVFEDKEVTEYTQSNDALGLFEFMKNKAVAYNALNAKE